MLFFLHKLLASLAVLSMITGVSAAVFFRRNNRWLKIHKSLNISAVLVLFLGLLTVGTMVFQYEGQHLNGLHPRIGISAFGFALITLLLGFYQFQAGAKAKIVRTLHRVFGRLTLILIIGALILGLMHAGII